MISASCQQGKPCGNTNRCPDPLGCGMSSKTAYVHYGQMISLADVYMRQQERNRHNALQPRSATYVDWIMHPIPAGWTFVPVIFSEYQTPRKTGRPPTEEETGEYSQSRNGTTVYMRKRLKSAGHYHRIQRS